MFALTTIVNPNSLMWENFHAFSELSSGWKISQIMNGILGGYSDETPHTSSHIIQELSESAFSGVVVVQTKVPRSVQICIFGGGGGVPEILEWGHSRNFEHKFCHAITLEALALQIVSHTLCVWRLIRIVSCVKYGVLMYVKY